MLSKSAFAFCESAKRIPVNKHGHVYLWTFTFTEALPLEVALKLWAYFLKLFSAWNKRQQKPFQGLRVFEIHPGEMAITCDGTTIWLSHGLHIHVLTDCYWHVNAVRRIWQQPSIGGGRVHAKAIPFDRVTYPAKYLSKQVREECLKGKRLWASFGGFDHTRVKDIEIDSPWTRAYRRLEGTVGICGTPFKHLPWWKRRQMVHLSLEYERRDYSPALVDGELSL